MPATRFRSTASSWCSSRSRRRSTTNPSLRPAANRHRPTAAVTRIEINGVRAMTTIRRAVLASLVLLGVPAAAPAQEVTVKIGNAPSIGSGALLIAAERGYFREVGIKVVIESLDTAANAIALLAQNQFQVIEGGLAAGYFNAIEKNLPITIAMSRVSTPLGHNMMLRADLKDRIREIKQLKGRVIATNGTGAVSTYEIGKLLETAGLTIVDVDFKVIPVAQY